MYIFPDCTYPHIGGVENMIFNIIKEVKNKYSQTSMVIGSRDTYLIKRLTSENIAFEFVDQHKVEDIAVSVNADDTIIFFHNSRLDKLNALNCKAILWGVLVQSLTEWNYFSLERKINGRKIISSYFTRKLLMEMTKLNSLVIMDGTMSDAINSFMGRALNIPIIPIPVEIPNTNRKKKDYSPCHNPLRVSYVGRSDDIWKIKPLKKVISDLGKIKDMEFVVSIYTRESKPFMQELAGVITANITLEFHFDIYGNELRNHLTANADLHFSMGTAALEGALAGVPTILIDPSFSDLPDKYKYKWLYETNKCSLGRFIDENEDDFEGLTINEVVETCLDNDKRKRTADLCIDYVEQNHSVAKVVNELLSLKTDAMLKDVARYTPSSWQIASVIRKIRQKN